jgi:hypothetical protein
LILIKNLLFSEISLVKEALAVKKILTACFTDVFSGRIGVRLDDAAAWRYVSEKL